MTPMTRQEYKDWLWSKVEEIQVRARIEARPFLNELERLLMEEPPPPIFLQFDQLCDSLKDQLKKVFEDPLTGGSGGNIVPTPPEIDPGLKKD